MFIWVHHVQTSGVKCVQRHLSLLKPCFLSDTFSFEPDLLCFKSHSQWYKILMLLHRCVLAGKPQWKGHKETWPGEGLQLRSLCHSHQVDHIDTPLKAARHLSFSHRMQQCSPGAELLGFGSSIVEDNKFPCTRTYFRNTNLSCYIIHASTTSSEQNGFFGW